jgi:hypothetical protein
MEFSMSGRIRFPVTPRDVPPDKAARRLHLTFEQFELILPELIVRGFPRADPTTGNYDLAAIDRWMDKRSGLTASATPRDAADEFAARFGRLRHGH